MDLLLGHVLVPEAVSPVSVTLLSSSLLSGAPSARLVASVLVIVRLCLADRPSFLPG